MCVFELKHYTIISSFCSDFMFNQRLMILSSWRPFVSMKYQKTILRSNCTKLIPNKKSHFVVPVAKRCNDRFRGRGHHHTFGSNMNSRLVLCLVYQSNRLAFIFILSSYSWLIHNLYLIITPQMFAPRETTLQSSLILIYPQTFFWLPKIIKPPKYS